MMKRDLTSKEKSYLDSLLLDNKKIVSIIGEISELGKAYLVGGAVRDIILFAQKDYVKDGVKDRIKDVDIEVHNITVEDLKTILEKHGRVDEVGKSFGVLKFSGGNIRIDWSIPRSDSPGRKPTVEIDIEMSITEALKRRDLTINAMAIDLKNKTLIDPFGGENDLQNKILRATNKLFFIEDPLRLFRVMQFIARFEMVPDQELNKLCKKINIENLSQERIRQEFKKTFLLSKTPSRALRWLQNLGRLKQILPELDATVGVEQNKKWHPEGDVFEHTMQAVDGAAKVDLELDEKLILIYGAIGHDLGKAVSSRIIDGRITSRGHEISGVPIAKKMLPRMTGNKKHIQAVLKLIRYHMHPGNFIKNSAKAPAYKKLARKLVPETNLRMLILLCRVDKQGRNPLKNEPLTAPIEWLKEFEKNSKQYKVFEKPEEALITGKDIIDKVAPGKEVGIVLKKAYEIQLNESIKNKEELKKRLFSSSNHVKHRNE